MNTHVEINIKDEKYLVIDILEYNGKKYFLVSKLLYSKASNEVMLCKYNEESKYFEIVESNEENSLVMSVLKNKYQTTKNLDKILNNISIELIKLRVVDIDNHFLYTLKDPDGKIIKKDIEFYIENKPKINSYIYMSKSIIKEKNIFQYGEIYDLNNVKLDEIIKIKIDKQEKYLQRYYG